MEPTQTPMQGDEFGQNMTNYPQSDEVPNKYDSNFDAGVEADEDTDPKKYIQQLTGKLSTTLNSFNNENDDEGLNKYVAKMIVKQATKHLDKAAKKDIIKAINLSGEDKRKDEEPEEEIDESFGVGFDKVGLKDKRTTDEEPLLELGQIEIVDFEIHKSHNGGWKGRIELIIPDSDKRDGESHIIDNFTVYDKVGKEVGFGHKHPLDIEKAILEVIRKEISKRRKL